MQGETLASLNCPLQEAVFCPCLDNKEPSQCLVFSSKKERLKMERPQQESTQIPLDGEFINFIDTFFWRPSSLPGGHMIQVRSSSSFGCALLSPNLFVVQQLNITLTIYSLTLLVLHRCWNHGNHAFGCQGLGKGRLPAIARLASDIQPALATSASLEQRDLHLAGAAQTSDAGWRWVRKMKFHPFSSKINMQKGSIASTFRSSQG